MLAGSHSCQSIQIPRMCSSKRLCSITKENIFYEESIDYFTWHCEIIVVSEKRAINGMFKYMRNIRGCLQTFP